jgi:hypothetical protein
MLEATLAVYIAGKLMQFVTSSVFHEFWMGEQGTGIFSSV